MSIAVSLYPFGAGNGDKVLPLGENSNSGVISLTTPAIFYGKSANKLIVRNSNIVQNRLTNLYKMINKN